MEIVPRQLTRFSLNVEHCTKPSEVLQQRKRYREDEIEILEPTKYLCDEKRIRFGNNGMFSMLRFQSDSYKSMEMVISKTSQERSPSFAELRDLESIAQLWLEKFSDLKGKVQSVSNSMSEIWASITDVKSLLSAANCIASYVSGTGQKIDFFDDNQALETLFYLDHMGKKGSLMTYLVQVMEELGESATTSFYSTWTEVWKLPTIDIEEMFHQTPWMLKSHLAAYQSRIFGIIQQGTCDPRELLNHIDFNRAANVMIAELEEKIGALKVEVARVRNSFLDAAESESKESLTESSPSSSPPHVAEPTILQIQYFLVLFVLSMEKFRRAVDLTRRKRDEVEARAALLQLFCGYPHQQKPADESPEQAWLEPHESERKSERPSEHGLETLDQELVVSAASSMNGDWARGGLGDSRGVDHVIDVPEAAAGQSAESECRAPIASRETVADCAASGIAGLTSDLASRTQAEGSWVAVSSPVTMPVTMPATVPATMPTAKIGATPLVSRCYTAGDEEAAEAMKLLSCGPISPTNAISFWEFMEGESCEDKADCGPDLDGKFQVLESTDTSYGSDCKAVPSIGELTDEVITERVS